MKREFMSISGLKNVLSPKEMKEIVGAAMIADGVCCELHPTTGMGDIWACTGPRCDQYTSCPLFWFCNV